MSGVALLLGRPAHPNVVALVEELPRHRVEPRVLDPRAFAARATTVRVDGRGSSVTSEAACFDGVGVGWFSSQETVHVPGAVAPPARRFARAAATAALVALRNAPGVPWVNDPYRAARAGDKVWQLGVARARGFAVPETLLTNDPERFRAFVRARRRVAVKSPSGSAGLRRDRRALTQLVTPRDLTDADAVALAPVLAQAYVEKKTEVRATVVGGRVFAAEIHSQATPRTRVDWRRYDPRTPHARADLPAAVRRRCVQVARDCGLDYAGIDLVRTPEDEYVFLEANSEPAWLWVEEKVGLPITRALAGLLARRARHV